MNTPRSRLTSVSIKSVDSHVLEADPTMSNFMTIGQITDTERKCLELDAQYNLSISKYDLPLEFHPKVVKKWTHDQCFLHRHNLRPGNDNENQKNFEKYILSQKTSIMHLCESHKPERSSRFEFLKPGVLWHALEQRPNFYEYRKMAIHLLRKNAMLKLQIIANNEPCSIQDIPNNVFSWSASDYFQRLELDNTYWLDVYEREFKDCLETQKFKFDVLELSRYLDLILCGATRDEIGYCFDADVIQALEDASDLLSVFKRLENEVAENRYMVSDLKTQYEASDSKTNIVEIGQRANLVQMLADSSVLHPIQNRYQEAWYTAQADQVEAVLDKELGKYQNELSYWADNIQEETSSMQNTMNMYYTEIEYYKTKVNEFTTKFDSEYEDLDNAINYKKLSMGKLEAQRKQCLEQLEVYKEELITLHAKREEEERIRKVKERAKAEAELLKLLKAEEKKLRQQQREKAIKKK